MADLLVVVGVLAFFALCVLYVAGLDRLVGRDGETESAPPAARDAVGVSADAGR